MKGGTVQINWHDTKPVLTLDFHPISGTLATGGADYDIKLWLINSGEKIPSATYHNSLSYHSSAVNVLRFSPSGEQLASGADGGELIMWKVHATESGQTWKVHKTLSFHRKDVLDLEWSTNGSFVISGSVDNSCIIWDVSKGSVHQILDGHFHYVQGVAWDPLGKYAASISSDRTCRIYLKKPQTKAKGADKINYVCQHVISKAENSQLDDSKSAKNHLFHDETLPSFFRRLAWSPDGSFLLVPAGSYKVSPATETMNTAYVFSRKDLSRPALQLPGASKPIVAVRSLTLDVKVWEPSVINLFQSLGNTFANCVWEELLQSRSAYQLDLIATGSYKSDKTQLVFLSKPSQSDSIPVKEKFIHAKYADKLFVRRPKDGQYNHVVAQQMWESVRANDKKAVYRHIVNSEPDVNAVYEQASCASSLTLAKVMLMQEQTNHDRSSSCLAGDSLEKSSASSSNVSGTSEVQALEDLDGCTLLHLACETADIGMLELLLQYGANVNVTDSRGQTPLDRCILKGKSTFAKLLLTRGADPRAPNGEGKTPLELAVESNFDDGEVLNILSDSHG